MDLTNTLMLNFRTKNQMRDRDQDAGPRLLSNQALFGRNASANPSTSCGEKSVQVSVKIPDDLQQLSNDFSRLLNEEINPDATLTCDGRTWRVHRSILAVRSEVFAAMLMTEIETGLVHVEDLESHVMDSLLNYIYSGKVLDLSAGNVFSLYPAADRYALYGLRKACSRWMVGNLSDENCLNVLVVADAHGDATLKEAAAAFICGHPALFECATWKYFVKERPTLGVEVLQRFAVSGKSNAGSVDCLVLE